MDKDFCRKAILGAFVQGYFHNLRGSLQGVYLPLQRIMLNPSKYLTEEGLALFQKMMSSLDKLNNQLNIALADLICEDEGPWDLFEVMQKEMLFWEADLRFKHKIKKEVIEKSKTTVKLPYNLLLGLLCLVEAGALSSFKRRKRVGDSHFLRAQALRYLQLEWVLRPSKFRKGRRAYQALRHAK